MSTTTQDWRTLPAGRELDALVAERVMGWTWVRTWRDERFLAPAGFSVEPPYSVGPALGDEPREEGAWWLRASSPGEGLSVVPHYTTDIAAAWELVEALHRGGQIVEVCTDGDGWQADVVVPDQYTRRDGAPCFTGRADTAPLAICRAALAAVEVTP